MATEVESHAQAFVEIVELDKLREDAFAVYLGNARATVSHIEEDAAIAFTSAADGDVSLVGEFVGVMQQFAQYADEILLLVVTLRLLVVDSKRISTVSGCRITIS